MIRPDHELESYKARCEFETRDILTNPMQLQKCVDDLREWVNADDQQLTSLCQRWHDPNMSNTVDQQVQRLCSDRLSIYKYMYSNLMN